MMALTLRDFDAENDRHAKGAANASDAPLYSFTEEELGKLMSEARQQGEAQGHAEGLAEGRREAQAEIQAQAVAATQALRDQLAVFVSQDTERRAELERDLIDMVLEIAERVVPDFIKLHSAEQVQTRLAEAISKGARHAELEIRVSPETEALLAQNIAQITPPDQPVAPKLMADTTLRNGEAKMTWENGLMTYSLDRVCDEILKALRHASEQMKHQTQKV
ncbi:FliH/SctL family protein [Cognatishimia maritima]|uniref:Flagellar assembly protein FliH n=1 Tax=Cognatishimia maritima TaxID=870908 RepID=A0A1M5VWP1_9RHOB|nr:FliH/SctL family protein [Cognatishimia maritima]SHH79702.1 Flagellar biosynthesis/type III secretory pathway protein FliH [Cognatishimia maritima]